MSLEETQGPRLGDVPPTDLTPTMAAVEAALWWGVGNAGHVGGPSGWCWNSWSKRSDCRRTTSLVLLWPGEPDGPRCGCPGRGAPMVMAPSVPTAPGTQSTRHQGRVDYFPLPCLLTALHPPQLVISLQRWPLGSTPPSSHALECPPPILKPGWPPVTSRT